MAATFALHKPKSNMKLPQLKIALPDDHDLFREGLANFLQAHNFAIVASERDGKPLIDQFRNLKELPDLCIVDVNMPTSGYTTTKIIKRT